MDIQTDGMIALMVLAFIAGDYVTGLVKAAMNGNVSSTIMRRGLWHKLGFVLALVFGYACQMAVGLFELPEAFNVVYAGVAVYLLMLEMTSIYENLCEISPELKESPLRNLFDSEDESEDNDER